MAVYETPLRVSYDAQTDDIVIRLGSGRRPRPVVTTLDITLQAVLDEDGRLVRIILFDNKILRLGRRLAGLTVLQPPPDPLPGGTIYYDLAARLAWLTLAPAPDDRSDVSLVREGRAEFDGQARLLALRLPVRGTSRRDPTLYRALAYLQTASDDRPAGD